MDFLYEDSPLFKVSCLSLSKLEKKNALRLIARKIERELKEDG